VTQTSGGDTRAVKKAPARPAARRGNPVAWLNRFIREVVAELRKVIWPTRRELVTYTTVVVVFVSVVVAIVATLDFGFARAVLAIFG
jgi:preprotein translocase subunit SecE